jgi:hypothetical protein
MLGIAGQGVLTGVESADGRRRRRALSGEGGMALGPSDSFRMAPIRPCIPGRLV